PHAGDAREGPQGPRHRAVHVASWRGKLTEGVSGRKDRARSQEGPGRLTANRGRVLRRRYCCAISLTKAAPSGTPRPVTLSQPGPVVRPVSEATARAGPRSEERRVGKECRSRWGPDR